MSIHLLLSCSVILALSTRIMGSKCMEILDCTLRDGSHAVAGGSFQLDATVKIIETLIQAGVKVIEFGKPSGIGAPKGAVSDEAYLQATQTLTAKAELGMFCRPENFRAYECELVEKYRPGFLRMGTNAGNVEPSEAAISKARKAGIKVRYSLIQAHCLSPAKLAENAKKVAGYGAQAITIMDSTGTMLPSQVGDYVSALVQAVDVPVGFHGHNNLGLSIANALAAVQAGAASLDGAIGGLARSAGNAPTEMLCAVLAKEGSPTGIDWFRLLDFLDHEMPEIAPGMKNVPPLDLIYGYAGFHSRNLPLAKSIAEQEQVNLYRLIVEVSGYGVANPDEALFKKAASVLK